MNNNPLIQIKVEYEMLDNISVKIIYLSGRITLANSVELSNKLKKYFDDENYNVIIDLSDVQYLDSKGMAIILTLEKTIKENNGILLLTKSNPFVQDLFHLTSLETYFTFIEDINAGRSYFLKK